MIRPVERTFSTMSSLQKRMTKEEVKKIIRRRATFQKKKKKKGKRKKARTIALIRYLHVQKKLQKKNHPNPSLKPSLRFAKKEEAFRNELIDAVNNVIQELRQELDERSARSSDFSKFKRFVLNACAVEDDNGPVSKLSPLRELKRSLRRAYLQSGLLGLRSELEYILQTDLITSKYYKPHIVQQLEIADLRHPEEWYPYARQLERTIHLHVGPTNSGKTYQALKRLQTCKKGFYAGPLRLLAQEVYQRFLSEGVPCSLVTGDDVKIPEDTQPRITSNTVEMASLTDHFEVGVIDEVQMMADSRRGWAWTRAVLGARVNELHLCGESRVVPLIRKLAAITGDKLQIHRYERLSPLKASDHSLRGDLKRLQKGDCVVSFSRLAIHTLKADIEKTTGRRAAIVYGGLPAEIRQQQANLFNDPDNDYDFLVASDAIGMGLNF